MQRGSHQGSGAHLHTVCTSFHALDKMMTVFPTTSKLFLSFVHQLIIHLTCRHKGITAIAIISWCHSNIMILHTYAKPSLLHTVMLLKPYLLTACLLLNKNTFSNGTTWAWNTTENTVLKTAFNNSFIPLMSSEKSEIPNLTFLC